MKNPFPSVIHSLNAAPFFLYFWENGILGSPCKAEKALGFQVKPESQGFLFLTILNEFVLLALPVSKDGHHEKSKRDFAVPQGVCS